MIINQKQVKSFFKKAGMRVPAGFMNALDSLVIKIVESAVESNGLIRKEVVQSLADKSSCKTMGKHVAMAYKQIKNTPLENTGVLFQRAKQIAQEEKK